MDSSYKVIAWDNAKRWLVVKCDGKQAIGYLVELNLIATGRHWCGCKWFECHRPKKSEIVSHCKHIRMVEDHVYNLWDRMKRVSDVK